MPQFVIERQYLIPMYQHIVVEAENLEDACKKAISDHIDWDTQEMDSDGARKTTLGHVRQAGGDSRLKMRRHGSASLVESGLRSVPRRGSAIDGMADCAATGVPLSSPAPSAHRCAAAGLDSGPPVERLASMPFDGAVDRLKFG